ncbi:uncharacterized protein LOC116145443 [Pistacia vera]|uniref:uncharacterized protein LOC116145443 n=1 Tax=Pistacia vera TaxID=55513 RepID=UPI001262B229|nr:uncharacterized protein LOC116145443 [Pistacia vera]
MLSISRPIIKVPDKEGREANHEGEKHPFEGGNSPIILLRDFEDKEEKSPVSIISGKGSKQGKDISKSVDGFGKETWPFFILGYDTKILPEDISNRRLGLRPLDVLTIMLKKLGMDMEKCVPGQNSLLCPAFFHNFETENMSQGLKQEQKLDPDEEETKVEGGRGGELG